MRKCSIDGCASKHEGFGYCKRHYKSYKKYGDAMYIDNKRAEREAIKRNKRPSVLMSTEGTCRVDGCESDIKSRGLCEKHYARMRRTGEIETRTIERNSIDTCIAVGCNKPHKTNGYCDTHYQNYRKTGSPQKPQVVKLCGVRGCNEPHQARGYCQSHYHEWERNIKNHNLHHQIIDKEDMDHGIPKPPFIQNFPGFSH